jgi:DNA-binding transcriptional LysR family regulator
VTGVVARHPGWQGGSDQREQRCQHADDANQQRQRRFGKFRPRFVSLAEPVSLAEELATAANEGAISMHPIFISHLGIPNVVMVPIADKEATWDLFVVWQHGKAAGSLRALLDTLTAKSGKPGTS